MSNKKNTTVFAEGKPILTTSPYEKYYKTDGEELDLSYADAARLSEGERVTLRLECLKLAITSLKTAETTKIFPYAKKIWKFVTKEA